MAAVLESKSAGPSKETCRTTATPDPGQNLSADDAGRAPAGGPGPGVSRPGNKDKDTDKEGRGTKEMRQTFKRREMPRPRRQAPGPGWDRGSEPGPGPGLPVTGTGTVSLRPRVTVTPRMAVTRSLEVFRVQPSCHRLIIDGPLQHRDSLSELESPTVAVTVGAGRPGCGGQEDDVEP